MSRKIRDAASIPSLCARSGNTNIETAIRDGAAKGDFEHADDRRNRRIFAERAANQEHQHGQRTARRGSWGGARPQATGARPRG